MDWALIGEIIGFLLAFGVGMGCGSYATMPYYRLPNGEACAGKWVGKKSHCTKCGIQLRTRDLIPILNWIGTRGKCYGCGIKINPVYFFIESSVTLLSVLAYLAFSFEQYYILILILATALVIASATDFSYRVVPDQVLVVIVMTGFLWRSLHDGQIYDMVQTFVLMVLLGLMFSALYEKKTGSPLASYRYIKIMVAAGIWLNYIGVAYYLGGVILLIPICYALTRKQDAEQRAWLAPAFLIPLYVAALFTG